MVAWVECLTPLHRTTAPDLSPAIDLWRAAYTRPLPAHYAANPIIRARIDLNLLLFPQSFLLVPASPRANLNPFYAALKAAHPPLFRRILSPFGTAKVASTSQLTPIKEITQMTLAGLALPGDEQLYGWEALHAEAQAKDLRLELAFQGNGLYFNRGSVFFDGDNLLDFPNRFLAEFLAEEQSPEALEWMGVSDTGLKRPLLFFTTQPDQRMGCYTHTFLPGETYSQGMARLQTEFQRRGILSALAASPPLILPGPTGEPEYLPLPEILARFHANDVRHWLYCPYEKTVLLSAELARLQSADPAALARAFTPDSGEQVTVRLLETLNFVRPAELCAVLDRKGYAGRYCLRDQFSADGSVKAYTLSIAPLEGVYSHLVPFVTRQGRFGLLQTSGTRGNITGNDGPTYRQLSAILRDLNSQPLFASDPMIAAASGSQGNDVPNIVCRAHSGNPALLAQLSPAAALDENPIPRGVVTTPRVGIVSAIAGH